MLADWVGRAWIRSLETLQGEPTSGQALALLWAVGWLEDLSETTDMRLELILVQYLFDEDPELREAAARAFRVIPRIVRRPGRPAGFTSNQIARPG